MNKKIQTLIEKKIKKNFLNSKFLIKNTSSKHKTHKQNILGNETHFLIILETIKFTQLSKLERQRLLLKILGKDIIDKVHSISMKLSSPNEKKYLINLKE
tara:strand:- start:3628 stop:3927 length:300 start_codon:yes stop_codon:yes gene_type:complete